ncbi:NIPSNAP family protein [Jiangella aurantiaca]|uniref:NIPSNAP family protein n=1 Tax=Jiangella aurantiaca TaxID=2530373 RepID=A0A4V2YSK1_9ACTN|nr:NIPSNAP family protein [Jiangella aurantiaca]TDD70417.1 NIPSNAP family protein [Jiangella aurantiaca]
MTSDRPKADREVQAAASPARGSLCCPIVELRQYTVYPERRDDLITIFDREFVESQEVLGMRLIGQFRDLDAPNRFVWIRGFADMATRHEALTAFYSGPVWKRHGAAANATMIDVDDVHLLHPVDAGSGFPFPGVGGDVAAARPPAGATLTPSSLVSVVVYPVAGDVREFGRFFAAEIEPALGVTPLARLETDRSPNTFPGLPVREDANAFVWAARFDDAAAQAEHTAAWESRTALRAELDRRLSAPPVALRLAPTARSLLR